MEKERREVRRQDEVNGTDHVAGQGTLQSGVQGEMPSVRLAEGFEEKSLEDTGLSRGQEKRSWSQFHHKQN